MGNARSRAGRAAAAGLIAAVLIMVAPVMAQAATPSATVTPSTDLLDAQLVTVSGTGFAPNATAYVGMCAPGATSSFDCDSRQFSAIPTNATGSFTTEFRVIRFLRKAFDTTSAPIDCATVTCSIGTSDFLTGSGLALFTPVQFADVAPVPPTLAAAPDDGLVDGQVVQVTGSGFRPGETVSLTQCLSGATTSTDCSPEPMSATVDPTGALSGQITVDRVLRLPFEPFTHSECAPAQCTIGVTSIAGFHQVGLAFAQPTLTITVDPSASLKAGTDDVVAQTTISCDIATPVSLMAAISQPGVQYRWNLRAQSCTPGEPLLAFLPSRIPWVTDTSYSLGSADVTVTAAPLRSLDLNDPPGVATEATEPVELVDHDQLSAVIHLALQDPANTELRAQVLRAIGLRIAQDPVFQREFAALINGS